MPQATIRIEGKINQKDLLESHTDETDAEYFLTPRQYVRKKTITDPVEFAELLTKSKSEILQELVNDDLWNEVVHVVGSTLQHDEWGLSYTTNADFLEDALNHLEDEGRIESATERAFTYVTGDDDGLAEAAEPIIDEALAPYT